MLCLHVSAQGVGQSVAPACVQALEARKTAKLKRVYYDLEDMIKTNKDGQTPYTPVLPLLYGMQASLQLLRAEGFDNVKKRHHRYSSQLLLALHSIHPLCRLCARAKAHSPCRAMS